MAEYIKKLSARIPERFKKRLKNFLVYFAPIKITSRGLELDKIPYFIFAPPYRNNSAGVRALHRLAHILNNKGYPTYVNSEGNPAWNEKYMKDMPSRIDLRTIVVYPEIVDGNPMEFKNRVRWVLYTPSLSCGPKQYDPEELVFVWSKFYLNLPSDRILTVKTLEDELFNKRGVVKRDADRFWVGKGLRRGAKIMDITKGLEEITHDWPTTREELAQVLKRTKTFYTYDDCTQLNWEAFACGCRVILLPENKELKLKDVAPNEEYKMKLKNFIKVTQKWARESEHIQ